ncbi:MAG TPA: type I phosphomannose isomerase catalytic subunit [Ktedonobacterales bacterium]
MADARSPLVPLPLVCSLHPTLWGGRRLEAHAGKPLPPDAAIGESWETELSCAVREGPHAGTTLGVLVERMDEDLLGWRAMAVLGPRFPLLAKFLDARQALSVQVHPDDAYAAAHENGKLGKTEVWYILHAEPGAQIVYGLRRASSREEVRAAIESDRLEELLAMHEVTAGDVIFVSAGTVHAIGGGILLYELQEYSDVTYRLYDYGRLQSDGTRRALHIESSLDVMRYAPANARSTPVALDDSTLAPGARRVLAACRYFVLEEIRLAGTWDRATSDASCEIVSVLEGECRLSGGDGPIPLRRGETAVLPARLGAYRLAGEARLMRSYVPEEDDESLAAWRAAQPSDVADELPASSDTTRS